MTDLFATIEDYLNWTGDDACQPTNAVMRRAASRIRFAIRFSLVRTMPDGITPIPTLAAALRDATCAQVAFWDAAGEDGTGAAAVVASASFMGASYTRGSGAGSGGSSPDGLCQEAVEILTVAGLLGQRIDVQY